MDQKIAQLMRGYEFVDFSNEIIGGGSYRNVYVEFNSSNKLSIAERGEYLMKLESELIEKIDSKIRVWHVPIGDKNSLRNLRGVTIK